MIMRLVGRDGLQYLFGSLVAEIDAAQHEKRHEHAGKKIGDGQGCGEKNKKFVAERTGCNPAYDGQLPPGRKSKYVSRCNGGIVDYDSGRFGPSFGSLSRHIVKRGRCHLRDRGDIIEQPEQPDTHRNSFPAYRKHPAVRTSRDLTVCIRGMRPSPSLRPECSIPCRTPCNARRRYHVAAERRPGMRIAPWTV